MNRKKRAKFADITNSFHPDDSSLRYRERSKAESPKTSEYAFFKKFKASASLKEQIPLKKPESTSRPEENNLKLRNICKHAELMEGLRNNCKFPTRDAHNDYDPFLSPITGAPKRLDGRKEVPVFEFENTCSSGERPKQDHAYLRPKGSEADVANIFSIKRQKLRLLVTENSLPGVDDPSWNGRLLPRSNSINNSKLPEARRVECKSNTNCISYPLSDVKFRKIQELPARTMVETEFLPRLEGFQPPICSGGSGADVISNISSPISYPQSGHLQMKGRKPNTDFGFSFPLEKYECLQPRSPLRQLGNHHDPTGTRTWSDFSFEFAPLEYRTLPPLVKGDYHKLSHSQNVKQLPLLLGWNSEVTPNDRSLIVPNTRPEFASSPSSLITLDDDFQSFHTSRLHAPFALLDCPREVSALVPTSYTFNENHERSTYLLEDEKFKDADEHIPLASSHQLSIPDQPGVRDIFLSTESYYSSIMHKILGQRQWSLGTDTHYELDEEWKNLYWSRPVRNFSSAFDYHALPYPKTDIMHPETPDPFGEYEDGISCSATVSRYRRKFDHFREDTPGFFDRLSFDLETATGEERACPLLLDESSWEERTCNTNTNSLSCQLDHTPLILEGHCPWK